MTTNIFLCSVCNKILKDNHYDHTFRLGKIFHRDCTPKDTCPKCSKKMLIREWTFDLCLNCSYKEPYLLCTNCNIPQSEDQYEKEILICKKCRGIGEKEHVGISAVICRRCGETAARSDGDLVCFPCERKREIFKGNSDPYPSDSDSE